MNTWKLNNILLTNVWVKEEIKGAIKYLETKSGETTYQNLWDTAKVIIRGKCTTIKTNIKKQEISQIT